MFVWTKRMAAGALSSRRGSVTVIVAILLPVIIGAAGLGTEMTFLLYQQRQIQVAADAAALGASMAVSKGYPAPSTEAIGVAAALGFVDGVSGVTVTVKNPPSSGSHTSSASAVEVIISQTPTLPIAQQVSAASFVVNARAVALQSSGGFCVLSTDPSSSAAGVNINNGATVNLGSCGIAANATSAQAITVSGGSTLTAQMVSVSGQVSNVWSTINAAGGIKVNQAAVADPYASVAMPTSAGCANNGVSLGWSASPQTLSPGTYCSGLNIANGAIATLSSGIYYIKGGQFGVAGGSTVTGTGVTIVLTNQGNNYATVSISNGATVALSAPMTGATAGIVFFGDRNASASNTSYFVGGSGNNYTGALYLPTQSVSFSDGVSSTSACTQLIAYDISIYGGASVNNTNCSGVGVSAIGGGANGLQE